MNMINMNNNNIAHTILSSKIHQAFDCRDMIQKMLKLSSDLVPEHHVLCAMYGGDLSTVR